MLIGRTRGVRLSKGATGRSGLVRWVPPAGAPTGGPRYPGRGPLVLGGLALCAVAVVLMLVRRGGRGAPQPEEAAPPPDMETPEGRPSDPSGGGPRTRGDVPEPSPGGEVGGRIRARIAEDPRTRDLPPVSIGVEDGMAWIEGSVPSPEAREALTDVVGGVEGVNIVVNRVVAGGT